MNLKSCLTIRVLTTALAATTGACTLDAGASQDDGAPAETIGTTSQAAVDNTYAVGVIPQGLGGAESGLYGGGCENGTELVTIYMDDEDNANRTGWGWSWRLPQDSMNDLRYAPKGNWNTRLRFCKVNGQGFHPMTTDPNAKGHFYAVLKLGTTCPNKSTTIFRWIENERDRNENSASGPYAPNSIDGPNTMLQFCLFRSGDISNVLDDFPNLGMSYAVYHDFEGEQPFPYNLGLGKAQHVSDDEDTDNGNITSGGTASARADFSAIISSGRNTVFDLATVW